MKNYKSYRHKLAIWSLIDFLLAIGILFVFLRFDTGIFYWIKGLFFSIFFMFGLLAIKDVIFASDADILKKMKGGGRKDFEPNLRTSFFVKKLKIIHDKYSYIFLIATIIFSIFHFSNIYFSGMNTIEVILIIIMIIFGLPVLMFW